MSRLPSTIWAPKGDPGDQGPPGPPGPIGPPGPDGGSIDALLRENLLNSTNPELGLALIGFIQNAVTAVGRSAVDKLRETWTVTDFMTRAEILGSIEGTVDTRKAQQAAIDATKPYGNLIYPAGLKYLIDGPNGLIFRKPITVTFEDGARLLFNHNEASYIITATSDITLIKPWIDGGSTTWLRRSNAGIRVQDDGVSAVTRNIKIIKARIENTAAAGILVGWTGEIANVTIDEPVIIGTKADGVSIAYNTHDVSILAPKCYNTGDDGVSIVSYLSSPKPCKDISVTDALSVNSGARGLTVVGGEDIKVSGQSIGAAAQGVLVLQDIGQYNTYPPKRVRLDVKVYNSEGIGCQVGANAEDITGQVDVVGAKGTRGVLIGSNLGNETKRVSLAVSSYGSTTGTGVEVNYSLDTTLTSVSAQNNWLAGLTVGAGTRRFAYGVCNVYNNNVGSIAGVDNILLNGVIGFCLGPTISIDDNTIPRIERTLDVANCSDGIIGPFIGKRSSIFSAPNIQATCSNVITTGGIGPGMYSVLGTTTAVPSATHFPAGSSIADFTRNRINFFDGVAWKYITFTG